MRGERTPPDDFPMAQREHRTHIETIVRRQIKQTYCNWPGGPGCERLGQNGECCGAFGWRTLDEFRTQGTDEK